MPRSISASDVIATGEASLRAAIKPAPLPRSQQIAGFGVVQIPLVPVTDREGVLRLVNSETGQSAGIFASPEVAQRTQQFFSK